jgi:hypothetical protein
MSEEIRRGEAETGLGASEEAPVISGHPRIIPEGVAESLLRVSRDAWRERWEDAHNTLCRYFKALEKLRGYNVAIAANQINYRPEDHIAVIDAALAAPEPQAEAPAQDAGPSDLPYYAVVGPRTGIIIGVCFGAQKPDEWIRPWLLVPISRQDHADYCRTARLPVGAAEKCANAFRAAMKEQDRGAVQCRG